MENKDILVGFKDVNGDFNLIDLNRIESISSKKESLNPRSMNNKEKGIISTITMHSGQKFKINGELSSSGNIHSLTNQLKNTIY